MAKKIKEWWKSKTFWIGILTIAGGIFTTIAQDLTTGAPITALGIINVVLRFVTKNEIKF